MNKNLILAQLQAGQLTLPKEYKSVIKAKFGRNICETAIRMFEASWHHYLLNKGTISLPYWSEQFNNPKAFNLILRELSNTGWFHCITLPNQNWSEAKLREEKLLEFVPSLSQLESIRAFFKYQKYMLKAELPSTNNLTRINGKVRHTGLTREGFFKTGMTQFQFDTETIKDYYDIIVAEVNKGMTKVRDFYPEMSRDSASYDEVATSVVNTIINQPEAVYSAGQFHSDSRGRNISGMLDKIFNPIGFKVARACLVIPEQFRQKATKDGLHNIYLFIAELCGFKKGTIQDKINFGRHCYYSSQMAVTSPNFMEESHRKDMYENIWLARLYTELDEYFGKAMFRDMAKYSYSQNKRTLSEAMSIVEGKPAEDFYWSVPIEIDMSALTF